MLDKDGIAKRIAKEIKDGYYVNLGIGIPTLVANYIPRGINVVLQSENGLLGMGPFPFEGDEDPDRRRSLDREVHRSTVRLAHPVALSEPATFLVIRIPPQLSPLGVVTAFEPSPEIVCPGYCAAGRPPTGIAAPCLLQ